ncbi:MAG: tRNA pseudouridine(38-40) synthase TruA [Myxococcota bacterium]
MPSRLVAAWCWYHGGGFRGYQSQPQGPTVQDTLKEALRSAGLSRNPVPSGRTDLGVHARMQVLSLRVVEGVSPEEVAARVTASLPRTVGLALSRAAPPRFNAAWSASGKEYRYRLLLADDARWAPCAWRVDVDVDRLAALLARAPGTRDFFAFHDKSSTQKPRRLRAVSVTQTGGRVDVRLEGDGFGRYMARCLVGAAVGVARGEVREDDYLRALEAPVPFDAPRAPPQGLVLWNVEYPRELDPFTAEERQLAPGVPEEPPFIP